MNGLQSEFGPPKCIIYVQQKARAVELWGMLSSVDSNQQVGLHHSSLRNETRQKVKTEFRQGKLSIVIATIGFGMVNMLNQLVTPPL